MSREFESWLGEVNKELNSNKVRMEDWQDLIPFNFGEEFTAGTLARDAALKAARYRRRENLIVDLGCSPVGQVYRQHIASPRVHYGIDDRHERDSVAEMRRGQNLDNPLVSTRDMASHSCAN
jgi:hypothetical protein